MKIKENAVPVAMIGDFGSADSSDHDSLTYFHNDATNWCWRAPELDDKLRLSQMDKDERLEWLIRGDIYSFGCVFLVLAIIGR